MERKSRFDTCTHQSVAQEPLEEPGAGHTHNFHGHLLFETHAPLVHQGSQINKNSQPSHAFLLPRERAVKLSFNCTIMMERENTQKIKHLQ